MFMCSLCIHGGQYIYSVEYGSAIPVFMPILSFSCSYSTSMHLSLKDDLAVWQKCFYFQLGQDAFREDCFCLYIGMWCFVTLQRRRRRSGWSGQGRTTFQQVVGLISRLQRRSANEMVGPGVPRKLAFAQRVGVSRINRSCCFASRSCRSLVWRSQTQAGAARPDCIGTHVLLNTHAYTTCSC